MQFINIVVHSVENMNFRVHLQYEFTRHGLDDYLEASVTCDLTARKQEAGSSSLMMMMMCFQRLKFTESDRLLVQIQAYLDNVFDVGALLEDAETKNALLEHMEELQEHNTQVRCHTCSHRGAFSPQKPVMEPGFCTVVRKIVEINRGIWLLKACTTSATKLKCQTSWCNIQATV